jgi:hypothetical protein
MKKPFWHRITNSEVKELIAQGKTNEFVMSNYRQPTWCEYPEALNGTMGCWSLTDNLGLRRKISKKFCSGCDCFKNKSIQQ